MPKHSRSDAPRISLSDRALTLEDGRAQTAIEVTLPDGKDLILVVDIYGFLPQCHPENHLGWWHFNPGRGKSDLRVEYDLSRVDGRSVRLFKDKVELAPPNGWINPDYALKPLQDCTFLVINNRNDILARTRLLMKVANPDVLAAFVREQNRADGWAPELPFLNLLHDYKLRILGRYFRRFFRGRVLDVGCGLSLFTAFDREFPFKVVAGDLSFDRIRKRKVERPGITWLVFDAALPPFLDGSFNGVFAGEILEHLPQPETALREWNRVQKRDGIIIITTPNRRRRVNILNEEDWPISPDHIREFSFDELNGSLLPRAGFKPLRKKAVYLEIWIKYTRWLKEDHLQREGNKRSYRLLMQVLFRLGYWFPRKALDLITVARKV
jgi:SAM-dependent methyltransferase